MSFPHSFNDLNLPNLFIAKTIYGFIIAIDATNSPPPKNNVVRPGCPAVGVSYAVQARFMSFLFRIQVSFL